MRLIIVVKNSDMDGNGEVSSTADVHCVNCIVLYSAEINLRCNKVVMSHRPLAVSITYTALPTTR